ncbi:MAG TPA: GSCFA domain-containing protein [Ferruginibacter sp.]|nr:GSCFA domain-containing protein [Ferruginibacter sp.]HRE62849.1 GSCFA domain-containing protein [Ferruginibacter sp.]
MNFRLEFIPKGFETKLKHSDRLFLAGSCFTEQIGSKLAAHKFRLIDNPNGILFNPVSIASSIINYIENKQYRKADLFYHNELWGSWEHHTKFSALTAEDALQKINESQTTANLFLKSADWLMLTLGSAFVYEREGRKVVANCHKVPTDKFNKRLLSSEEVISTLDNLIHRLKKFNPKLKIIFTISPVRHLRDGFVENNRSKATLIQSVHHLVDKFEGLQYFPAYELIIDDLRDYRFFAEDMVHPNYAATNYVWEKFVQACIDESSQQLMKEINIINAAMHHKPFNPQSEAHKNFLKVNLQKLEYLATQYDYIDFSKERNFFES